MTTTFVRRKQIAEGIYTFYFQSNPQLRYIAGQFIELELRLDRPDQRGSKRWFTLSSSPTEELLAITTRVGKRMSSFKESLMKLSVDEQVSLRDPMGDFVLPKDPSIPLTFVARGIGITPVRSMIKWLSDTHQARNIRLIYATRDPADQIFLDVIRLHGVDIVLIANDDFTYSTLLSLSAIQNNAYLYVSGPETVVEALTKDITSNAQQPASLIADYFHGYDAN